MHQTIANLAAASAGRPLAASLDEARASALQCRACPLWRPATQTVFGEGPEGAALAFVGEQPGHQEDLVGRPFVGPAGLLFAEALPVAGIDRAAVYITNAVKHFKFTPRGKRRIHQRPNGGEISACRWWLSLELALVRPRLVVALGATALHSLTGRHQSIASTRGKLAATSEGIAMLATIHPSYLLRIPDRDARDDEYQRFVTDLRRAREIVAA